MSKIKQQILKLLKIAIQKVENLPIVTLSISLLLLLLTKKNAPIILPLIYALISVGPQWWRRK